MDKSKINFLAISVIVVTLLVVLVMGAESLQISDLDNLQSGGNYSTTMNFTVNLAGVKNNSDAVSVNVTLYYNASGGPITRGSTNNLTTVHNGSTDNQSIYNVTSLSVSGLAEGTTYNFTVYADNGTTQTWIDASGAITIDRSGPNVTLVTTGTNATSGSNVSVNFTVDEVGVGVESVFFNITNGSTGTQLNVSGLITASGSSYFFSYDYGQHGEGYFNVTVWANDSFLNNLNNSEATQVRIDDTVPTVTLAKSTAGSDKTNLNISITVDGGISGVNEQCTVDTSTGITFSGTGTSQSFVHTGLDCGSSHSYSVTCDDWVNNSKTTTGTFTVDACSTGGGSSGGGGGGGGSTSTWSNTYSATATQVSDGYTKSLSSNQRIKVEIGGEEHHVGVKSVSGGSATIEVASDPVTVSMSAGDSEKFDVNDDDVYDLLVTLNSISGSNADVTVKSISEPVPQETAEETTGSATDEEPESGLTSEESGGASTVIIVVVVLVILAVAIGLGVAAKRRSK